MDEFQVESGTRVGQVMDAVRRKIAGRSLPTGTKLPSIRAFAATLRVSTSTVVDAYDRLAAEGTIRSRPGSGFYVVGPPPPLSLADIGPQLDRAVDPLWVSRQSLGAGDEVLKPGCGWLPSDWMPEVGIRRKMRCLSRGDAATLTDYGEPRGLAGLRQLLVRQMAAQSIEVGLEQILLTESATQALDLVGRFLIEPGQTVLLDDPCYFNFQAMLRAHRAEIVSVRYTPTGPDVAHFAKVLATHRPRLYVTNAALHNPTGATLSPLVAHQVLTLATAHGLTIVEDDVFADFEREPAPRLAAFDGLDRVVRIGSFSKTLSASARCGYIAARPDWIEGLIDLLIATNFGGPGPLAAELVLGVLRDGGYRKHLDALRQRLARAMDATATRLAAIGIRPWTEPRGGLYLWCRLPDGLDAADVARAALAEGVVLAPGNVFSVSRSARSFLRFNVAQSSDARIFTALERAMAGGGSAGRA